MIKYTETAIVRERLGKKQSDRDTERETEGKRGRARQRDKDKEVLRNTIFFGRYKCFHKSFYTEHTQKCIYKG